MPDPSVSPAEPLSACADFGPHTAHKYFNDGSWLECPGVPAAVSPADCPECQGRGEVPATPGQPGDGPMQCDHCDGTGAVSPADPIRRLTEWSDDMAHVVQSVRMHEPTYRRPSELRRDVRALLAVGKRDKAEIERLRVVHRTEQRASADRLREAVTSGERDRQQIAQLTEALEAADWLITCYENVQAKKVVRGLDEAKSGYRAARAVLAGEEDTGHA